MFKSTSKKIAAVVALFLGLAGCAHVNSVSLTPIPSKRSNPIQAQVSKTIILAFNFDNDYINPLIDDLKRQCPNGVVSGILTKDETISYILVHTKKITASGFCNVSDKTASANKGPRRPSSQEETPDSAAPVLE